MRRLIEIVHGAFRIVASVRERVLIDRIAGALHCTVPIARERLDDLAAAGYVSLRGYGAGRLVFAGPMLQPSRFLVRRSGDADPPALGSLRRVA